MPAVVRLPPAEVLVTEMEPAVPAVPVPRALPVCEARAPSTILPEPLLDTVMVPALPPAALVPAAAPPLAVMAAAPATPPTAVTETVPALPPA
jgi:hypothetical protein